MDISQFKRGRLLVAGEVGIDEYIEGNVTRISPEAPVPVLEVNHRFERLGLAANVAQNLTSLGARVTLLSLRGQDEDGERIAEKLKETGVEPVLVEDPSRPTLRKVRVLSGRHHIVRVDYEKTHSVDTEVAARFRNQLCDLMDEHDGIIVQDYGKGLLNPDVMGFISEARRRNKPVYVDPSRMSPPQLYRGATLLSPNLQEAAILSGNERVSARLSGEDDGSLKAIATRLIEDTDAEHMVITCGAAGMVSLSRGKEPLQRIPTYAKEVFDVTGAGDTVIAVLALTQVLGHSLAESMRAANAAAGIVVGRIGTASVTPEELEAALKNTIS